MSLFPDEDVLTREIETWRDQDGLDVYNVS